MNTIEITKLERPVTAKVDIPGSKSYTNRALVMASLTKGPVTLFNPLYSEDTEAMIGCLRRLGLRIETLPDRITVYDDISIIQNKSYDLYAKDSGTTIRFLLALLCLAPGMQVIRAGSGLMNGPLRIWLRLCVKWAARSTIWKKKGSLP